MWLVPYAVCVLAGLLAGCVGGLVAGRTLARQMLADVRDGTCWEGCACD